MRFPSLLALSLAAVATPKDILSFAEFHATALRIAKNYLKPVKVTQAKCTPDMKLHPNGKRPCYVFAAGDKDKAIKDETLNPGNIANDYFNADVSVLNAIYYSEYNKFIISDLAKQRYEYALVVADKDPKCEIALFNENFIQDTILGEATITITLEKAKRSTDGFINRDFFTYTSPFGTKAPGFTIGSYEEHQKVFGTIVGKMVGQSFHSVAGGSCTPYTLVYGIVCENTNFTKYLSKGSKIKTLPNPSVEIQNLLMPLNMHDNDLLATVSGCVDSSPR